MNHVPMRPHDRNRLPDPLQKVQKCLEPGERGPELLLPPASSEHSYRGSHPVPSWDSQAIWSALMAGKVVRIWSRTLREWILWVRDEKVKPKPSTTDSEKKLAAYTIAELRTLTQAKPTPDELIKLHQSKFILGGTFVPLRPEEQ